MKANRKTNLCRQALALISGSLLFLASFSIQAGTISGSKHDFSTSSWSGGQICVACHTPHNADTSVAAAPLWNHELTTTAFTLYSSPTFNGVVSQPTGASKLCLSCHDGTVAIDSFGGATGGTKMTGNSVVGLGGNLNDDHPISFLYDTALANLDGGLHDPSTPVTIGLDGDKPKLGTIDTVMLIGGEVQCVSCHDVHNTNTVPDPLDNQPLLKVSTTGSALCLTCHNK